MSQKIEAYTLDSPVSDVANLTPNFKESIEDSFNFLRIFDSISVSFNKYSTIVKSFDKTALSNKYLGNFSCYFLSNTFNSWSVSNTE